VDVPDPEVLILATLETKREACDFFCSELARYGVAAQVIDISLNSGGAVLDGDRKVEAMSAAAKSATSAIIQRLSVGPLVVVAFGGGTGSQIALSVFERLPFGIRKFLITTLAFDIRPMAARLDLIVVPTIVDIIGMNATLRAILEGAAAAAAGAARIMARDEGVTERRVGLTAMGVTTPGIDNVVERLRAIDIECTVFHAVGYGGLAFETWVRRGAFSGVVDLTTHEVTRLLSKGDKVSEGRFSAAGEMGLPQVVMPGACNLHCLGPIEGVDKGLLERPHYKHSEAFTHIQLSPEEMRRCASILVGALGKSKAPVCILVPMRGFSSEDRPGGAIDSPQLRSIFRDTVMEAATDKLTVKVIDAHLNEPAFAQATAEAYLDIAS
jgi:uncharacterized protein (UPF0261 family)